MLRHLPGPLVGALAALALAAVGLLLLFQYDVFTRSSDVVHGSGVPASQSRPLPVFSGVELAGANLVTVRVGGKQSVVVHADANLLEYVTTDVQDGRLVIGNAPGSIETSAPMHIEVQVPKLESLKLTGSGLIRASGTTDRLEVTVSGAGDAQVSDLVARDVHAVVSGSGRILVTATHSLDASIPGSGAIFYGGNPEEVTKSVTGSGAVTGG